MKFECNLTSMSNNHIYIKKNPIFTIELNKKIATHVIK